MYVRKVKIIFHIWRSSQKIANATLSCVEEFTIRKSFQNIENNWNVAISFLRFNNFSVNLLIFDLFFIFQRSTCFAQTRFLKQTFFLFCYFTFFPERHKIASSFFPKCEKGGFTTRRFRTFFYCAKYLFPGIEFIFKYLIFIILNFKTNSETDIAWMQACSTRMQYNLPFLQLLLVTILQNQINLPIGRDRLFSDVPEDE